MKRLAARAAIIVLAAAPLALFAVGPASAGSGVTLLDGVTFTATASGNTVTPTITNTLGADVYCFILGQNASKNPTSDQPDFTVGYPYGYLAVWAKSTWRTEFLNVPDGDYTLYSACVSEAPANSNLAVDVWKNLFATNQVQAIPITVPGKTCIGSVCLPGGGFGS